MSKISFVGFQEVNEQIYVILKKGKKFLYVLLLVFCFLLAILIRSQTSHAYSIQQSPQTFSTMQDINLAKQKMIFMERGWIPQSEFLDFNLKKIQIPSNFQKNQHLLLNKNLHLFPQIILNNKTLLVALFGVKALKLVAPFQLAKLQFQQIIMLNYVFLILSNNSNIPNGLPGLSKQKETRKKGDIILNVYIRDVFFEGDFAIYIKKHKNVLQGSIGTVLSVKNNDSFYCKVHFSKNCAIFCMDTLEKITRNSNLELLLSEAIVFSKNDSRILKVVNSNTTFK